jgi:hypothetical protein
MYLAVGNVRTLDSQDGRCGILFVRVGTSFTPLCYIDEYNNWYFGLVWSPDVGNVFCSYT